MNKIIINFIFFAFFASNLVSAKTLDEVKNRGYLKCGVSEDFIGFSNPNDLAEWEGFNVDFCKSVAIAIFNDSSKIKFIPLDSRSRFPSLAFGEVDLLFRNTTWTFARDVNLEFEFIGTNFYDGQGFMVPKNLNITDLSELDGAKICTTSTAKNQINIENYFLKNEIDYELIISETNEESLAMYIDNKCQVYSNDVTILANYKSKMPDANAHLILDKIISKEPLGPLVRHGDNHWADIVRWTLYSLIIADEKGINNDNVDEFLVNGDDESLRLLGVVGNYGNMLELENDWAYQIIKEMGNYNSIFAKNLGNGTSLGLNRGINNLWNNGGILYAPPFR